MMEQLVVSVQAEQKRTYYALALGVTKSTNDTISGSDLLHLNCRGAFTGSIRSVQTLRDDAVKVAAGSFEPFVGKAEISRRWRKLHIFSRSEIPTPNFSRSFRRSRRGCLKYDRSLSARRSNTMYVAGCALASF